MPSLMLCVQSSSASRRSVWAAFRQASPVSGVRATPCSGAGWHSAGSGRPSSSPGRSGEVLPAGRRRARFLTRAVCAISSRSVCRPIFSRSAVAARSAASAHSCRVRSSGACPSSCIRASTLRALATAGAFSETRQPAWAATARTSVSACSAKLFPLSPVPVTAYKVRPSIRCRPILESWIAARTSRTTATGSPPTSIRARISRNRRMWVPSYRALFGDVVSPRCSRPSRR